MNRLVNAFVIYQFIRLLIKPFDQTDAFKLGIIDKDGNYLKKQGDLKTAEEKKASNIFTRLVWNLKKILNKVPVVRSKLGKFATALYLVREQAEYIGADGNVIEEVLTEYLRSTNPAIVDEILSMEFENDKYIIEDLELEPVGSFMGVSMYKLNETIVSQIDLDEIAMNSAGGNIGGAEVSNPSPNIKGYSKPMMKGIEGETYGTPLSKSTMMRRDTPKFAGTKLGESRDVFMGKNVYEMDNQDYYNCVNGRKKYERWSNKVNVEDIEHAELKRRIQKFGEAIIKNKMTGEMCVFRNVDIQED
tara:strand:- start:34 stop:942 length:909 start_codon:yes stop_codon:yes gene_type:complete